MTVPTLSLHGTGIDNLAKHHAARHRALESARAALADLPRTPVTTTARTLSAPPVPSTNPFWPN